MIKTQTVLTFDGVDDYIDFGRNDLGGVFAQGSSAFTVSGWLNPHKLTNKATSYGTRNVFLARSSERYSDNFEFGISEAGSLDIYIDETVTKGIKTFGQGELTIGVWHFFAIVFNSGQLTIYLDKQQYTDSLRGTALNKATSPLTLGATLHKRVYFAGQLANISVWNYPCTSEQIQVHRCGLIAGDEPGLVAYWKLDEGEGKTVKSQTVTDHQGNLRGNPSWDVAQIPLANQSSPQDEIITTTEEEISPITTNLLAATVSLTNQEEATPTNNQDSDILLNLVTLPLQITEPIPESTSQSEVEDNVQPAEVATLIENQVTETMETTAKSKYKILSIDGGGIRGIIPALLLAEIERRTQKPIFSLFDLIAGTSSGGILALGLTQPRLTSKASESEELSAEYTAEDLLQLFLEYGVEIFYEPFFERILGPIEDIFLQPKYPSNSKEEILRQYFGTASLENNLKEVFVTSYDIEKRVPIFFTNQHHKEQIESQKFRNLCGGFSLLDVALATSATPTYFAPHRIPTSHNISGFYTLIDGGVFANNPAHLAIIEAQISSKKEANRVLNLEDILVVSLGTGSLTSVYPHNSVKNWGLLQWTRPLLNIVLDGNSEVVSGELERLFEPSHQDARSSYYRFQPFLDEELEAIDNIKLPNTRKLQAVAHQLIAEYSQQIDELCNLLLV
ncbi:patatin-like phospholipase family protein [Nostoc sp. FACHB-87]|uniref:patatin-like phospholipase family protein n=1 Tax=Nostocales TaxID=1161 RepID=UPI001681F8B2|nr:MULTISPECIES: patatin-like phospholipase family protein [Nostocales]MBD2299206.1 patatin-like phospholipase family protein [Nostoc sp. FACHB-190]MBD2454623.1 patatin-like phospholipase family protein [Nostoc sp. FACHB-87]MBD2476332.1 patatin-like phospholipase family protein [Anabaena sp. FACHB-83]MBD2488277.1 patatin-like phospholipase family protein [Aulosira sp. FACHB-615]